MNDSVSLIKTAVLWKIGLPVLVAGGALLTLIFLPILMIGAADESDSSTDDTVVLTGLGVSDAVPEEYRSIVLRAGTLCEDITPAVIAAQIEAESNWDPTATSPAGAAGISQFMPGTWTTKGSDGDGDGVADITNPQDAIWSQGAYMCELREGILALKDAGSITGSTLDLTLAAYNAGLGNVLEHGGVPPFEETTAYITKIKELASTTYASSTLIGDTAIGSASIVTAAKQYLGRPYRGEGADGLDCCVFVQYAVRDALGITLPLSTPGRPMATAKCEWTIQNRASEFGAIQISADIDTLQPGDLLFHQSSTVDPADDSVTHVSIYIGDGNIIDSAPGVGVTIKPLSYYATSDPLLPVAVRFPDAS